MTLRKLLAISVLAALAPTVLAQGYPNRTVKMVVSFPPGAGTDVIARLVARELQESFGHPVVVENGPGAAGKIAS